MIGFHAPSFSTAKGIPTINSMLSDKDKTPSPNFANANAPALPTFPSKNKPTDGSILLTAEALTEARAANAEHSTAARAALAAANVKGYDTEKEKQSLFSAGTFAVGQPRKKEFLTGTYAVVLDFDRDINPFEYDLITDHAALITLSRSGKGWHGVFLIEPNTEGNADRIAAVHAATVTALAAEMGFWPDKEGDKTGTYDSRSDQAARVFYLWNDPAPFFNEEPAPFPLAAPTPSHAQATPKVYPSLPTGTAKATPSQTQRAIIACEKRITETFTLGQRNTFILKQAADLNHKGTPLPDAHAALYDRYGTDAPQDWPEFANVITNVYKRYADQHGTHAPAPPTPDQTYPTAAIEYNGHLSTEGDTLAAEIANFDGICILKAETGAGKTKAICDWLKARAKAEPNKMHFLAVPTAEMAFYFGDRETMPYIRGGVTTAEVVAQFKLSKNAQVGTFDALDKVKRAGLEIGTLVVDEIHAWPDYSTFRESARKLSATIKRVVHSGNTVVGMSATPPTALLYGIEKMIAPVKIIDATPAPDAENPPCKRTRVNMNGNKDELLQTIIDAAKLGPVAVVINNISDDRHGKGVFDIESQLRFLTEGNLPVHTAVAGDMQGLPNFQANPEGVLIGTKAIENGFDIECTGKHFTAIYCNTEGTDPAALGQLGGRARNAESVEYIKWTFGKGKEADPDAPEYSICGQVDKVIADAQKQETDCPDRQYENLIPVSGIYDRLTAGIEKATANPVSIIAEALDYQYRNAPATVYDSEFLRFVPDCVFEDRESPTTATPADSPFTGFARAATMLLNKVPQRTQIALAASFKAQLKQHTDDADWLAKRLGFELIEMPEASLYEALTKAAIQQRETYACRISHYESKLSKIDKRTHPDPTERKKAKRQVKADLKKTKADLKTVSLFDTTDPTFYRKWLMKHKATFNTIYKALSELIAVNEDATLSDAERLLLYAFEQNERVNPAAIRLAAQRATFHTLREGGVGTEIPSEVGYTDRAAARNADRIQAIEAALPTLKTRTANGVTGTELLSIVREHTGIVCRSSYDALALVKVAANVTKRTGNDADGKRTTLWIVGDSVKRCDLKLSGDCKAIVRQGIEKGIERAINAGVDHARIFSFSYIDNVHAFHSDPRTREPVHEPPDPTLF